MTAQNLKNKIVKLGGKVQKTSKGVKGTLNGWDVHLIGHTSTFFTTRRITDRGHYDPGSDYNSGGYRFEYRLKDLEGYAK